MLSRPALYELSKIVYELENAAVEAVAYTAGFE
jgi:hypothetical protein